VTQGGAEQPEGPTREQVPASASGRSLRRKITDFFFLWLATALLSILLMLFNKYVMPSQVTLLEFQDQLERATSQLNPISLVDYVFEIASYLFYPIKIASDAILGATSWLFNWALSSIQPFVAPDLFRSCAYS
jgi:hypothetical protein